MDIYKTIAGAAEGGTRELGSRFLGFAWPVSTEEEAVALVKELRKKYHDATHVCFAWRLQGGVERFSDDGEPSGSAGRPIMGQLLSRGLTDVAVAVVRWFGGTKLGVPGLIAAYREAAAVALDASTVVERTTCEIVEVRFPWEAMNGVMRVVKDMSPAVLAQTFDNECIMRLSIRTSQAEQLKERLKNEKGIIIDDVAPDGGGTVG